MNIPKGCRLVKVTPSGVQFGNAWYSHESITGYSDDQLNQGNCCVTGGAYMKWLSEESPPQPIYDEAAETQLARFSYDADPNLMASWSDFKYGWLACAQSRAKAGEVGHE